MATYTGLKAFLQEINGWYEKKVIADSKVKIHMFGKGKKSTDFCHARNTPKYRRCFQNVKVALRIFLCMTVIYCNGEKSFTALEWVQSFLRSILFQDKIKPSLNFCLMKVNLRKVFFTIKNSEIFYSIFEIEED